MGRLRRRRDFFLPIRISDSAKRRAENRSTRSSPSNTLVIPNGRRAVMNVSGDSRQRGMPPATNNAALFIGTAFNPRVSVCASVTFRRRRYWLREWERDKDKERSHHPARSKFIPLVPNPADRFLRSSRNAARSIAYARVCGLYLVRFWPYGFASRDFRKLDICSSRSTRTICKYAHLWLRV